MVHVHTGDARTRTLSLTQNIFLFYRSEPMAQHIDRITETKIKESANIVDVVGDFLTLKKRGVEYVCLCPFHDDHTLGNFSVNPAKNCYKCFSCGAGGDAVKFLMEYRGSRLSYPDALRYLAKKYSISVPEDGDDERWKHVKPAKPREIVEVHKELLVMLRSTVLTTVKNQQLNTFIDWFRHLPWSNDPVNNQRARVEQTLWMYCVGPWIDGRVCFWQIDEQGRPHGGKLMRYGNDGKRVKTENPGWMHNQKGIRESIDFDKYEYRATLFGLHLLNRYPNAAINIVESEKTALICANAYGKPEESLWMACGGLKFLKLESLQPIIDQGRRIWLWPDKDGIDDWRQKCEHLLNERVKITTKFLDVYWTEDDGPKADVADIIIRHMRRPETVRRQDSTSEDERKPLVLDSDEPFLDPIEILDPLVHEWRQRLRLRYNFRNNTTHLDNILTVGEILSEHPILKTLIEDNERQI